MCASTDGLFILLQRLRPTRRRPVHFCGSCSPGNRHTARWLHLVDRPSSTCGTSCGHIIPVYTAPVHRPAAALNRTHSAPRNLDSRLLVPQSRNMSGVLSYVARRTKVGPQSTVHLPL